MIKDHASQLIEQYLHWLRSEIEIILHDDSVEIMLPFLDHHNDYIAVYLHNSGEGVVIDDGGNTISDLEMMGIPIDADHRKELVTTILNGFGIEKSEQNVLYSILRPEFASLDFQNLVQSILAVGDLHVTSRNSVTRMFRDDVGHWLRERNVSAIRKFTLSGRSLSEHEFDFYIPPSKSSSSRALLTLQRPDRRAAESAVFTWIDTQDDRPADLKAIAVLDDRQINVSSTVDKILNSYDITPVHWSTREESIQYFQ